MVKAAAAAVVVLVALVVVSSSGAALVARAKGSSLQERRLVQGQNVEHARVAIRWLERAGRQRSLGPLERRELRWSRAAVVRPGWLVGELAETVAVLEARRVASGSASAVPWPWSVLGDCETTGDRDGRIDWSYNGGSGFDGGLQFEPGTWSRYRSRVAGAPASAWQAPPLVQIAVARLVLARQGYGAWPACSAAHGLL